MYWEYQTISHSKYSLWNRIAELVHDPSEYIQFLGLRNHGVLNSVPVTELIYLHSKVSLLITI